MRINTNVGALSASRSVFVNNMAVEGSLRKLSSGYRIARAGDDAAGLAIANNLRMQGRSLAQSAANAEQGAAMLNIADSAAQTIARIVERQKELIVQKANGTTSTSASTAINNEITGLQTEAGRIKDAATYQGTSVFGSLSFTVSDGSSNNTVSVTSTLTLTSLSGTSTVTDADTALTTVNTALAAIGRGQNILDFTVQNLKSAVVNVRAAESTIRDADMAEEMAMFTRNSILKQAAESMLAQANQSSQGVLSLLR